jgi:DNA (cytosine-5)-methyltransferase 1
MSDYYSLPKAVKAIEGTGSLNPTWVEWLMGFPDGWTDLEP